MVRPAGGARLRVRRALRCVRRGWRYDRVAAASSREAGRGGGGVRAVGSGQVRPRAFGRAGWVYRRGAHGVASGGRLGACGAAGDTTAWLPLRVEKPGELAGLTNWYSFAIRPLYVGEKGRAAALKDLFARLRKRAARLTLYPVSDAEQDGIAAAMRDAGWWVRTAPRGDRHWRDLAGLGHDGWWESRPGALRNKIGRAHV